MAFIKFTEKQERLKEEVREFLKKEMTPEAEAEFDPAGISAPFGIEPLRKVMVKEGERGWLLPWLPEEMGGINASYTDALVLSDSLAEGGAPSSGDNTYAAANIVAPTLHRIGNEEQKNYFIPKIAKGEIEIGIGYTEPEAGTDLAVAQMRAVPDEDGFIINGQKVFGTHAHAAAYHWLLARTDQSLPKHKGLSLLLVDINTPGITISPMWCIDDKRINEVFYDNVRVPKSTLVGELNKGFNYVMMALQFERNIPSGPLRWVFKKLVEFVEEKGLNKDAVVQDKLADLVTGIDIVTLLSYKIASLLDQGKVPIYESSAIKVFNSELMHNMFDMAIDLMGPYSVTLDDPKWGHFAYKLRVGYQRSLPLIFGAGTNDMLRSYMLTTEFGLPRAW